MESNDEDARELAQVRQAVATAQQLAHQGATQLSLILGYSELLESRGPADQMDAAREIASAAHLLGEILGRLLLVLDHGGEQPTPT